MRTGLGSAGATLIVLATSLAPAWAQDPPLPGARGMAAARAKALEAQELADAGQLARALALVQLELDSGGDEEFEGLMAFALGWIEWQLANQYVVRIEVPTTGSGPRLLSRTEHLERSAEAYRLALEAFPQSAQARRNLALVERELGNAERALALLRAVQDAAPARRPLDAEARERLVLIGDLERELGRPNAALSSYLAAYRADRSKPAAAHRIMELHISGEAGAAEDLLAFCRSAAEAGHHGLALSGVEHILARSAAPEATEVLIDGMHIDGIQVSGPQGEGLGELDDLLIDQSGRLQYAVLSFGSALGMGEKLIAIPWQCLDAELEGQSPSGRDREDDGGTGSAGERLLILVLNMDKERLGNAPVLDKEAWLTMADQHWRVEVDAYFAAYMRRAGQAREAGAKRPDSAGGAVLRVGDLHGRHVVSQQGEDLGEVERVVIDASTGLRSFVVVSAGGFLDIGEDKLVVPFENLHIVPGTVQGGQMDRTGQTGKSDDFKLTLHVDSEELERAQKFDENLANEEAYAHRALIPAGLELWARIEARRGTLSAESLRRLPEPGPGSHPLLAELRAAVLAPAEHSPVRSWTQTPTRRGALVAMLRALAMRREIAGAGAEAAAIRERGLELALPLLHDTELPEDRFAVLDLALEQAALFSAQPQLDPGDERFARLEVELLNEKNLAYSDRDLEAMERFHIVLGLVYAGRGAWGDDGWRAAPYHLRRAVEVARRRQASASEHPLPHLTHRLARGLIEERHDVDAALSAFADAARGYAQAGDDRQAAQVLEQALELGVRASASARVDLASLRRELRELGVRARGEPQEASAPTGLRPGRLVVLRGRVEQQRSPHHELPQWILRSDGEPVELICMSARFDLEDFAGSEVRIRGRVLPYEPGGPFSPPARIDVHLIEMDRGPRRDR